MIYTVNFLDKTDSICILMYFKANSVDEAYRLAEEHRRTQVISPDDTEVWTIADDQGHTVWTAY